MKKTEFPYLMPLKEFSAASGIPETHLRNIVRSPEVLPFIHRIGKKIYIDTKKFFEWTQRKT